MMRPGDPFISGMYCAKAYRGLIELMHAEWAATADVASWLELVSEVEPLFGPMPDFETTLLRKIEQRSALCVRSGDLSVVLGGILLGGHAPCGWIRWLAVRSCARRLPRQRYSLSRLRKS